MAETRKESEPHEADLISKLPDEILTHILSYVNTNSAVATSVLSKRWKLVWISVPNLEFDYSSSINYLLLLGRNVRFDNLVDRVLSLNNVVSVRNVRLHCRFADLLRVTEWLKSLATRKAEKYDLSMPESLIDINFLPDGFYIQKNLVELKLINVSIKVPSTACFPRLKTIALRNVQIVGDESMKNLLSGCPVITHLGIVSEEYQCPEKILYIRSSTLQNLEIDTYYDGFVIDTPKLSHLLLDNRPDSGSEIINLPYLVKANLSSITSTNMLYGLLRKIPNVKELMLDRRTMTALSRGKDPLIEIAMLHNLTHITLSAIKGREELDFWLGLLTCTPDGASIIFKSVKPLPLNLPESIIVCISSVKISDEEDVREYMRPVITCNLKSAAGLKKLIFHGVFFIYILRDEFLRKFLPVSNESKINEAFVPGG